MSLQYLFGIYSVSIRYLFGLAPNRYRTSTDDLPNRYQRDIRATRGRLMRCALTRFVVSFWKGKMQIKLTNIKKMVVDVSFCTKFFLFNYKMFYLCSAIQ